MILGITPAYDILPHFWKSILFFEADDVAQVIGVCDVVFTSAYSSIIPDFSHGVRTYIELCFPHVFNMTLPLVRYT